MEKMDREALLVIKGPFNKVSRFKLMENIYVFLPHALKALEKQPYVDDKRAIEVRGTEIQSLDAIFRFVQNRKTNTLTIIVK